MLDFFVNQDNELYITVGCHYQTVVWLRGILHFSSNSSFDLESYRKAMLDFNSDSLVRFCFKVITKVEYLKNNNMLSF